MPVHASTRTTLGDPFDAEIPPRISSIEPRFGSLAGGTDLLVRGTGFGADASAISITVAGVKCDVTQIQTTGVHCRLRSQLAATAPTRPTPTAVLGNDLGSFAGERGARWQWAEGGGQSLLLQSFAAPSDCVLNCGAGWKEVASDGSTQIVEVSLAKWPALPSPTYAAPTPHTISSHVSQGWFEAPVTATYIFMVRTDATSTLTWSGDEVAAPTETLASNNPLLGGGAETAVTEGETTNCFVGARACMLGAAADARQVHLEAATTGGTWQTSDQAYRLTKLPGIVQHQAIEQRWVACTQEGNKGVEIRVYLEAGAVYAKVVWASYNGKGVNDCNQNWPLGRQARIAWDDRGNGYGLKSLTFRISNDTASPSPTRPSPSASEPVTAELWTRPSLGWTCSEPPCLEDFPAFGEPDMVLQTEELAHDFAFLSVRSALASRWSGRFRAPKTGDCLLTLATGATASATLFFDNAAVAKTGSTQSTSRRVVSFVADQWYDFQLIHYQGVYPAASLSVRLNCTFIPGDAFPINSADPSPMRRGRAYHPWPWPQDRQHQQQDQANQSAASSPVRLVAGRRYWMQLECTKGSSSCGAGVRILAPTAPHAASLGSAARRWLPRVRRGMNGEQPVSCAEISDKAECCAAIGEDGDVCVPAVTTYADGATCAGWNALRTCNGSPDTCVDVQPHEVAACPPQPDTATRVARPRTKLAFGSACSSLADRVACCSATDGRIDDAAHEDAPCVPAVTSFASGAVCESASHVFASEVMWRSDKSQFGQAQSAASCAELGSDTPLAMQFSEEASVAHDVQRLTLTQASPAKFTQQVTFTVAACPLGTDCVGGPARYSFLHGGTCADGWISYSDVVGVEECADACLSSSACGFFDFAYGTRCNLFAAADGCEWKESSQYHVYQLSMPEPLKGSVMLQHGGKLSGPLHLKATANDIVSAFRGLQDRTYSALSVLSIVITNSTVVWRFELTTPWAACSSQLGSPPPDCPGGSKGSRDHSNHRWELMS